MENNKTMKYTIERFIDLSGVLEIGITKQDILGKSRKEEIAIARETYWYWLNKNGLGCRKISQIDGRRKETILSGIRTIKNLIETDHPLINPYKKILE
jgi:chromosomal replication initiation ATPase DnaA